MAPHGIVLGAAFALALTPALAQNAPVASARATIENIAPDGVSFAVQTRAARRKPCASARRHGRLVVPASLADVKPGAFIGVAAMPGEGELKAIEVHIFPSRCGELARGPAHSTSLRAAP